MSMILHIKSHPTVVHHVPLVCYIISNRTSMEYKPSTICRKWNSTQDTEELDHQMIVQRVPPFWPSFPQWLLSADSSKAVDVMSVVSFWVSEQRATLPHWIGNREGRPWKHAQTNYTQPSHCQPNIKMLTHTVYPHKEAARSHRALWM